MNSNSKKGKTTEKLPKVEENAALYKSKTDLEKENTDDDWNNLPEKLKQLLEVGLK
jgi:hypothetical protein